MHEMTKFKLLFIGTRWTKWYMVAFSLAAYQYHVPIKGFEFELKRHHFVSKMVYSNSRHIKGHFKAKNRREDPQGTLRNTKRES